MATTARNATRTLEDFVTSYVSLLKQTESNQIALGREAFGARDFCHANKISFLKFCEATNMPRSTVYYHIDTYKAYTWLHKEKGVSKSALGSLPAGSIIRLQDLLRRDPEGAEEFVQELTSTDKARKQLELVTDKEAQDAANDELKKREAQLREELDAQWKSKVAAAKRGAKAEIEHLQDEVNTAQAEATKAAKRVLELEQDVGERIDKAAKAQTKAQAAKSPDAEKLKELRRQVKQLKQSVATGEEAIAGMNEQLAQAAAAKQDAIDESVSQKLHEELHDIVGMQLNDLQRTLRETRLTVSSILEDKPTLAHELSGNITQFVNELNEWGLQLSEWAKTPKPKKAAKKGGKK